MEGISPRVSIIAAIGKNREIGRDNQLLWRLPQDLKRFKTITQGHPVIMGRKTFESIGKPLPGRTNVMITRDTELQISGVTVVHTLMESLILAPDLDSEEVFVIGGGQVYTEALGYADRLYLTIVEAELEADTFFPEYRDQFPTVVAEESWSEGEYTGTYIILER